MKRRHFLRYGGLAAGSLAIAACDEKKFSWLTENPMLPQIKPAQRPNLWEMDIKVRDLEKSELILAYTPTIEIAPVVAAIKQGWFLDKLGLTIKLYKQPDLAAVTKGLQESRFDGAISPFSFPLVARLQNPPLPLVALMQLNRHGGAIALDKKAWDAGVRTGADYANFDEFTANYRPYLQKQQKLVLGVEDLYSHWAYLYRYWLAEVGVDPERQLTLKAFAPSQLSDKLGSGEIQGYCAGEPWGQAAIAKKTGFLAYLSQDTWLGHPGAVLTTTAGWHKNNPNTAKALVAGILFGCQWCQQQTTSTAIAPDLSPADVLDLKTPDLLEPMFSHNYNYGGFDENSRNFSRPDNILWFGVGQSLLEPDHANYPWRSHGTWMLTQMVRWQHLGLQTYPKDADKLIDETYTIDTYKEVAQAFKLKVPSTPEQSEASSQFIDQRGFDPSDPVAYINQFQIRS